MILQPCASHAWLTVSILLILTLALLTLAPWAEMLRAGNVDDSTNAGDERSSIRATPPVTLEEIRRMGVLITLVAPVEQTVEATRRGKLGGVACLLLARGDLLIGSDLSQATMAIDPDARCLTLTLPHPRVHHSRLDHQHTRILHLRRLGAWTLVPGEALEAAVHADALHRAQQVIAAVTLLPRHRDQAARQVQHTLQQLIEPSGWQCVIHWREG